MRRRSARLALAGVCGGLLFVAGYYLAPPSWGGAPRMCTAYVTTVGTSMEPLLHSGDLAVVREEPPYAIGDVVAYQSPELHTVVLHPSAYRCMGIPTSSSPSATPPRV